MTQSDEQKKWIPLSKAVVRVTQLIGSQSWFFHDENRSTFILPHFAPALLMELQNLLHPTTYESVFKKLETKQNNDESPTPNSLESRLYNAAIDGFLEELRSFVT